MFEFQSAPPDELQIKPQIEKVTEDQLLSRLMELRGTNEVIVIIEGVPTPSTLKQLAEQLTYEVSILVAKDHSSTVFIPQEENTALSDTDIKKLGLENYSSNVHNHPEGDCTPSQYDMLGDIRDSATYLVIARNGVSERKFLREGFTDAMYNYAVKTENTPWRVPNSEVYLAALRNRALTILTAYSGFAELSVEEKEREIGILVGGDDAQGFLDHFSKIGKAGWGPLVRAIAENSATPIIKFFPWEDEATIEQLLRGKTQLA
ncbi:MAG TPA: hypothetical protein VD999_01875 [Vitreimonas sp.]|nr:hypothetical protein [Vitreimonas sp.]